MFVVEATTQAEGERLKKESAQNGTNHFGQTGAEYVNVAIPRERHWGRE